MPRIKVEFAYDYMSRRISKKVYARDSGSWLLTSVSSFLYDAWNLIREETTASGTGKIVDEYIWGLDLSGSLQGAGGIGGLLSRQRREERYYDGQGKLIICHHPPRNPEQPKTIRINENIWPLHEAHGDTLGACEGPNVTNSIFFYTYDGNGNVSELLGTVNGELGTVGHYEYSPFGETIVSTGPEAQDNLFRFSTKYFDDETGLIYYGYRYYSPSLGRWLSHDPLAEIASISVMNEEKYISEISQMTEEQEGTLIRLINDQISFWTSINQNLVSVMANDPISNIDPLGLAKNPACIAQCNQDLANCYSPAAIAEFGLGGAAIGAALQGLNKTAIVPGKGKLFGPAPSGEYTSWTRKWFGRSGRAVGRVSVRGAGAIGAGFGMLALHAKCLSAYAGCRSGCPDDCP